MMFCLLVLITFISSNIHALQIPTSRRGFIAECTAATCLSSSPLPTYAADDMASLLDAKTVYWNGPTWSSTRYRASTLQSSTGSQNIPAATQPTFYPLWLEGYHAIQYKFIGASFPQGRSVLSLRVAGAGLGTCMSLPNVGYNPSMHAIHFIEDDNRHQAVYEDLAYNTPRRFEAFWPEAKVTAVQTGGGMKCLVSGDGCSLGMNPKLHSPASRVTLEFDAPTRRSGRLIQSTDVTMLNCSTQVSDNGYYTIKSYSQYNLNQDLQTFYKEITSWRRNKDDEIVGKTRVAAFLPRYVKDMDTNTGRVEYDENESVALYDYKMKLTNIDEAQAANL